MKTWLKELELELKKRFYVSEVEGIVSYYEEMIQDRLDLGEDLDDILSDYDAKSIAKSMTTEVIMKRANDTYKALLHSTKQLIIFLLSSPLLIPLGVVYIAILIFLVSMMMVSVVLIVGSIGGLYNLILEVNQSSLDLNGVMAVMGTGLMLFTLLLLVFIWLYRVIQKVFKKSLYVFSKIAKIKGEK